jgi:hypothetical protein
MTKKPYVAIVKIEYWDEVEKITDHEYFLMSEVASYAEAMSRIEEEYGEIIDGIEITLLEGPFVCINEKAKEQLIITGAIIM